MKKIMSHKERYDSIDVKKLRLERLSDLSGRAELYVVSLTFSILAISIQFPLESKELCVLLAQSAGWILLIISGSSGIKLLRNVTKEYVLELRKNNAIILRSSGPEWLRPTCEAMEEVASDDLARIKEQFERYSSIQGWCLVSGLSFLAIARIVDLFMF